MRTHNHLLVWWLGIMAFGFCSFSLLVSGKEPLQARLETLDQYSRIQIPITSGSGFRIVSGKKGEVSLTIERVATNALTALPGMVDSRIQKVQVKELGLDRAEITIQFRDSKMESFAYAQGNNLVLDLWQGKGQDSKVEAQAASTKGSDGESFPEKPLKIKSVKVGAKKKPSESSSSPISSVSARKPASSKSSLVAAVEPLRIDRDLFQRFILPMPELVVEAKDGGVGIPLRMDISTLWKFSSGNKGTEPGRAYEFAKILFKEKKFGLCLKTIEILLRDHPENDYVDEIGLLQALAYEKLGQATKEESLVYRSQKLMEELAARRDEDGEPLPFTRLIVLQFAKQELEQRNWLKAIQSLEYVSSVTKSSDVNFPYVQMLLALAYGEVNQPRRAERLYRYIVQKFPKHMLAKESYYRIADLLAAEKNYARVVEEGEAAIRTYPDFEKKRPETLFQIGEAYFWLEDYAKSEKHFRRFLEISSGQTIGSLALVRLGEISELYHKNIKAAREEYLKAKNGYPFTEGDILATVRLARIDLPMEKDLAFVVRSLENMLSDKSLDWAVKRMAEIALAEYLLVAGDVDKSVAIASNGMGQTEGKVNELYKKVFKTGVFQKFSGYVSKKQFSEALEFYEQEKKWLEEYGPETYRELAEVHKGLGLFSVADRLMERYWNELAQKGRKISSAEEKNRFLLEKAQNSFVRGAYEETLSSLGTRGDAHSFYLRAMSHYRLGHKTEAYLAAEKAVSSAQAESDEVFSDQQVEELADVLFEQSEAQRDYPKMFAQAKRLQEMCEKKNERITFASADALWLQKRHAEAEKAYKAALEEFPKSDRADRSRYHLGMSLIAQKKREEAVKVMTELKNSGQGVWSESAKQELELMDWEKKYSSVLRTLPPGGLGIKN